MILARWSGVMKYVEQYWFSALTDHGRENKKIGTAAAHSSEYIYSNHLDAFMQNWTNPKMFVLG